MKAVWSICMCSHKHILKEIVFYKKYKHIYPNALKKGYGKRTILELRGWRGKKEAWAKVTGCKKYDTCFDCNANDHMYYDACLRCNYVYFDVFK